MTRTHTHASSTLFTPLRSDCTMTPLTATHVASLRFEHLDDPIGIGVHRPRLSWIVRTATAGWTQAAYEIEVTDPVGRRTESTGPVESSESVLVPWPAADTRLPRPPGGPGAGVGGGRLGERME